MIDDSKWAECHHCENFNTIYEKKCRHCGEVLRYTSKLSKSIVWQVLTFRFLYFGKDPKKCGHDPLSCKCRFCGKTSHDWGKENGCRCYKCGMNRYINCQWEGCKCIRCGDTRDEGHDWDLCRCKRCKKTRETNDPIWEDHDWDGCICRLCGSKRDEEHEWEFGHVVLFNDWGGERDTEAYYCIKCGINEYDSKQKPSET